MDPHEALDLSDRVALITGGSRGIGRACAQQLAKAGARIAVAYHDREEAAEEVLERIHAQGGQAIALRADLSRPDQATEMVAAAERRWNRLDIVVNNAAIWTDGPIADLSDPVLDRTIRVNLHGAFYVTRAAVGPLGRAPRGGRLIFISSTAGQRGEAEHSHYAATKGALISLTKSLAVELAPAGILVNCVAPGWVETEMNVRPFADGGRERIEATVPLKRIARPEEIAGAVLFLASDLATFVTGEVLNVNGGAVLCG